MALHAEMRAFFKYMQRLNYLDGLPMSPRGQAKGLRACRAILDALILKTVDANGQPTQELSAREQHMTLFNFCVEFVQNASKKQKILRRDLAPNLTERFFSAAEMSLISEHMPVFGGHDGDANERFRRMLSDPNCPVGEIYWYKPDPEEDRNTMVVMCYVGAARGGWHAIHVTFPPPHPTICRFVDAWPPSRQQEARKRAAWENVAPRCLPNRLVELVASYIVDEMKYW